jgi:hypothetical protein
MRSFILRLSILIIGSELLFSCRKNPPLEEEVTLPEIITGTVKEFGLAYFDFNPPNYSGHFKVSATNGKDYYFEFGLVTNPVAVDGDNCAITIQNPALLLAASKLVDTLYGRLAYTGLNMPNTIDIITNQNALIDDTKGVKEIHMIFMEQTRFSLGFFEHGNLATYRSNINLSLPKVEQILSRFNDRSPDPGQQPGKAYIRFRNW